MSDALEALEHDQRAEASKLAAEVARLESAARSASTVVKRVVEGCVAEFDAAVKLGAYAHGLRARFGPDVSDGVVHIAAVEARGALTTLLGATEDVAAEMLVRAGELRVRAETLAESADRLAAARKGPPDGPPGPAATLPPPPPAEPA